MSQNSHPNPTPAETVRGGCTITITRLHGPQREPRTEQVFVRQIPFREYAEASKDQNDEAAMIDRYVGQGKGWSCLADPELCPESADLIRTEGERINGSFLAYCARKQETNMAMFDRVAKLNPTIVEKMMPATPATSSTSAPAWPPRPV